MPDTSRWRSARHIVRMGIILAVIIFFLVLIFKNIAPFGATVEYKIDMESGGGEAALPEPLTPSTAVGVDESGVQYQLPETKMITDMLTFDLEVPYDSFDSAEVTVKYKGEPQELLLGIKGDSESEFEYKPVHNYYLNQLEWDRVEEGHATLYQKSAEYETVSDFLAAPPMPFEVDGQVIEPPPVASYYYQFVQPLPDIDLSQADNGTSIDATLRGPHVFYVYVGSEPLEFSFIRQELNWKEGPDPLDVVVYSDSELIWGTHIPGDGDEKESRVISAPREVNVSLPGFEEGVYRVELLCGTDVVIKELRASQRYLSFYKELFVIDHELYRLSSTKPTTVYTNAAELSVWTWHPEAYQVIKANGETLVEIQEVEQKYLLTLPAGINEIQTEMGDVSFLSKDSSFAFSQDSFFNPFPVKVEEYDEGLLFTDIQYIIADYIVPDSEARWSIQEMTFDLRDTHIDDNRLRCVLFAPNLTQYGGEITLGSIEIQLDRAGR